MKSACNTRLEQVKLFDTGETMSFTKRYKKLIEKALSELQISLCDAL
jgi:transcriptional accessory protein Tex/SPT6